jgi:hypothetical protein
VVTKLDRLARSVQDLMAILQTLESKRVGVRILNLGMDTHTPTGKLMLTMLGAVAQFEREMMLERQRESPRRQVGRVLQMAQTHCRRPAAQRSEDGHRGHHPKNDCLTAWHRRSYRLSHSRYQENAHRLICSGFLELADPRLFGAHLFGHKERIAAMVRKYARAPKNTLVVSPDNCFSSEINEAIHAELQAKGLVRREVHRVEVLVPAGRTWAGDARMHTTI